jgi:chloramphenicol-sensitive protein RarD
LASLGMTSDDAKAAQTGLFAAIFSYTTWGFLPVLFKALEGVPSPTIVANRSLWSLLLVGVIMIVASKSAEVRTALADPATRRSMLFSALLLGSNWLLYVYAIESGQVLEASFGYFINPLMNVAVGIMMFGEKQNRWQMVSIGLAVVAILIQAVALGSVPVIALGLASTFAAYAYFRKTAKVSSATGLFVETLFIAPVAAGYLIFTFIRDGGIGPHGDPVTLGLLMLTGPATTLTLLLFAFAVRRVRMTTIGMLQYISPSIQFLLAIWLFGEHLSPVRLVSFGLIWVSLLIFTADSFIRHRAASAVEPA